MWKLNYYNLRDEMQSPYQQFWVYKPSKTNSFTEDDDAPEGAFCMMRSEFTEFHMVPGVPYHIIPHYYGTFTQDAATRDVYQIKGVLRHYVPFKVIPGTFGEGVDFTSEARDAETGDLEFTYHFRVLGLETVKTSRNMGRFEAWRVRVEKAYPSGNVFESTTRWYAPQLGWYVLENGQYRLVENELG